jgi:hypothetical protein
VSKGRIIKFLEELKWSKKDLKSPFEKKKHMLWGLGNPSKLEAG